ncbi:MAG: hypothetical protein EXR07_20490 [Acetobacteraceae bacterium]|nr:hypothetical protein [Acetobacteraceae bacterium]
MRRLIHSIAALGGILLGASAVPAIAAQNCTAVADQSAYEVLSLRTQMILLATKCDRAADYNNNFIKRFQPVLQANDRAVLAYFRRVYGNASQGRKDTFATELVNVMSQQANAQGGEFCPRAGMIINEMSVLRSMDELVAYAAVKDLAPSGTSMCPAAARRR